MIEAKAAAAAKLTTDAAKTDTKANASGRSKKAIRVKQDFSKITVEPAFNDEDVQDLVEDDSDADDVSFVTSDEEDEEVADENEDGADNSKAEPATGEDTPAKEADDKGESSSKKTEEATTEKFIVASQRLKMNTPSSKKSKKEKIAHALLKKTKAQVSGVTSAASGDDDAADLSLLDKSKTVTDCDSTISAGEQSFIKYVTGIDGSKGDDVSTPNRKSLKTNKRKRRGSSVGEGPDGVLKHSRKESLSEY